MIKHTQNVICPISGIPYIMSTLDKTFCHVWGVHFQAIPRPGSAIRKAISFFPRSFQLPGKELEDFWIHPVEKVVVIFVLVNRFQCILVKSSPVIMHLVGFPLCRILMTIGDKATIIPVLVNMFLTK